MHAFTSLLLCCGAEEHVVFCKLSPLQRRLYEILLTSGAGRSMLRRLTSSTSNSANQGVALYLIGT